MHCLSQIFCLGFLCDHFVYQLVSSGFQTTALPYPNPGIRVTTEPIMYVWVCVHEGRTCKLHADRPEATFSVRGDSSNRWTTVSLLPERFLLNLDFVFQEG